MGRLHYLLVTILLNAWIIGFLGFGTGGVIHLLLLFAFIVIAFSSFKAATPLNFLMLLLIRVHERVNFVRHLRNSVKVAYANGLTFVR